MAKTKTEAIPKACTKCPLARDYSPVKGEGKKGGILFLGEAPGKDEVARGKPFIGMSGQLLRKTAEALLPADIPCWFANSVLCRPPNNRTPTLEEIACCQARLRKEIRQAEPKVIVAMGNIAIRALFPDTASRTAIGLPTKEQDLKITRLRGIALVHPDFNVPVLPTVHPASLLRSPDPFVDFKRDFSKAHILYQGKKLPSPPVPKPIVPTTAKEAIRLLKQMVKHGTMIACDLETTGLHPATGAIFSFGVAQNGEEALLIQQELFRMESVRKEIVRLMTSVPVSYHNGPFDWLFLLAELDIEANYDFDTMLGHYLLDERRGTHKLDQLAREYLNVPTYKDELKPYFKGIKVKGDEEGRVLGIADAPKPMLYAYHAKDCCYTLLLSFILHGQLEELGVPETLMQELIIPAAKAIARVRLRGIKVDVPYLLKLQKKLKAQLTRTTKQLRQIAHEAGWIAPAFREPEPTAPNPEEVLRAQSNLDTAREWEVEKIAEARKVLATWAESQGQESIDPAAVLTAKHTLANPKASQRDKELAEDTLEAWAKACGHEPEAGETDEEIGQLRYGGEGRPLRSGLGSSARSTKVGKGTATEYNPNSTVHCAEVLYDCLDGTKAREMIASGASILTDDGKARVTYFLAEAWRIADFIMLGAEMTQRTVARVVLQALRPTVCPQTKKFIDTILLYRAAKKFTGTYIDAFLEGRDGDDRVHPDFLLHGSRTGRLASRGPNFQNIPTVRNDDIKRAIIAPPGWTFVACDYAQLEYRIAAYLSGDQHLYDIFLKNRDLHTEVATGIFNKPAEQITSKERYVAKFVDFGILYGRSAYSLAEGELECSVAEAQLYIDNFLKTFSSLKTWMAARWPEVLEKGYVENFFGRRRRFPIITKEVQVQGPKQAVNAPIQSLASDLTLLALVDMLKELDPTKTRPLWTIHDAVNLEIRTSCLDQQIRKVKEIMERPRLPNCPIVLKVDVKCGSNWGDAKKWVPRKKSLR